jgi:hypothetical protein
LKSIPRQMTSNGAVALPSLAFDEVVDGQQDQGAQDGHDETGLPFLTPANRPSQPACEKRAVFD